MNWPLLYRHALAAVIQNRLKLFLLFILMVGLLGVYLILEKPNYKTTWIMLLPGTERASTISLDNLGEARSNGGNAYGSVSISPKNTYKEIALSDAVINQAASEYGVEAYAFSKPKITLIDQTPAIQFTLKGESANELVYRAKLYNATFHKTLDELRENEIERNYEGIEKNLTAAKARLNQARQDIVNHQTETNFISEDQFSLWMNDAEEIRTQALDTKVKQARMEATINTTSSLLGISLDQIKALLSLQSSPRIEGTLALLRHRLGEQVSMKSRYAARNPLRLAIDREIGALSKEVRQTLNATPNLNHLSNAQLYALLSETSSQSIQRLSQMVAEFDGLNAQSTALATNQQSYHDRIISHTKDAATLADLQRDHQIAEAIFSSALAKLDTSRLDIYATYPQTQLLTQPGSTVKRDRLKSKLMIVATALIYGLLALTIVISSIRSTIIKAQDSGESLDSLLQSNATTI